MLIVLKGKNKNGNTKMNFSGVADERITGNTIIEYKKELHTHEANDNDNNWIEHKLNNTRKVVRDIFVVNADSTRWGVKNKVSQLRETSYFFFFVYVLVIVLFFCKNILSNI